MKKLVLFILGAVIAGTLVFMFKDNIEAWLTQTQAVIIQRTEVWI